MVKAAGNARVGYIRPGTFILAYNFINVFKGIDGLCIALIAQGYCFILFYAFCWRATITEKGILNEWNSLTTLVVLIYQKITQGSESPDK